MDAGSAEARPGSFRIGVTPYGRPPSARRQPLLRGDRGILDARSLEPQLGEFGIGVTPYRGAFGTRSRNPSRVPEFRPMLRRVVAFAARAPEKAPSGEGARRIGDPRAAPEPALRRALGSLWRCSLDLLEPRELSWPRSRVSADAVHRPAPGRRAQDPRSNAPQPARQRPEGPTGQDPASGRCLKCL